MQPNDQSEPNNPVVPEAPTPIEPATQTTTVTPTAQNITPAPTPGEVISAAGVVSDEAAVTSNSAASTPPVVNQPPKKRKKIWVFFAVAATVLVLGGGAAAAYAGIYLPNRPQRIAQQALANTINSEKIQSSSFEGEITLEGGDASKTISGVTLSGATSQGGAADITANLNTVLTKISLNAKTQDGQTIYIKLSGLKGLDTFLASMAGGSESPEETAAVAALIGGINDTWFMIDQSMLKQLGGDATSVVGTKVSPEDARKIGGIYKQHQFLTINKRLPDQDIHGLNSFHVEATINKEQLTGFLNDLKNANISSMPVNQETVDQVTKVEFSKYPFEMWVSKKGRYITQIATTVEDSGTKYKVRLALFDFNKPVNVEKPADAKSLLELLGTLAPLASGASTDLPLNL